MAMSELHFFPDSFSYSVFGSLFLGSTLCLLRLMLDLYCALNT